MVGGVDALLRRGRRQRRLPVQPTVTNHQLNLRARKGRLLEEEGPVDRLRALFDEGVQRQRRLADGHVRLHHAALALANGQLSGLFLVRTRCFLIHGRLQTQRLGDDNDRIASGAHFGLLLRRVDVVFAASLDQDADCAVLFQALTRLLQGDRVDLDVKHEFDLSHGS